jgi:O-antigen/teichoic acid export membrane protein
MSEMKVHVRRRFKMSVLLTFAAKVSSTALQLISIPAAVHHLKVEGYATFAAIFALSLAPQMIVLRHGPTLSGPVSKMYGEADWRGISNRLSHALAATFLTTVLAALVFPLMMSLGISVHAEGNGLSLTPNDWFVAGVLVVVHLLSSTLLVVEDVQTGVHEGHLQAIRIIGGNLSAILAVLFIFPMRASLVVYVLCYIGPPFLLRFVNAIAFMYRRSPVRPQFRDLNRRGIYGAFADGFRYTAIIGVGTYLITQFPIIAASLYLDSYQTASVSVIQQLSLASYAFASVIAVGFVPAYNTHLALNDGAWVSHWLTRIEYGMVLGAVIGVAGFAFAGPHLHKLLLNEDLLLPSESFFFAGMYAATLVIEHFYLLLAASTQLSMRMLLLYIARAVATSLFAWGACASGYAPGIWIAGSVCSIGFTIHRYRSAVWRHVASNRGHSVLS